MVRHMVLLQTDTAGGGIPFVISARPQLTVAVIEGLSAGSVTVEEERDMLGPADLQPSKTVRGLVSSQPHSGLHFQRGSAQS